MKTTRTFIAIQLPQAVKTELARVSQVLNRLVPPGTVRWVKPEQLHLTLRFLGETAVSKLPALIDELDRLAGQYPPCDMQLSVLGCFPNLRKPRVIWVGLTHSPEPTPHPLFLLQTNLETAVIQLGWQPEKPFHAHLTLGRVNEKARLDGSQWQVTVKPLPVPITAIHLVESQLRPSSPIYTVLHTSRLTKGE